MALIVDQYLLACQRQIRDRLLPVIPAEKADLVEEAGMVATIIGRIHADMTILPAVAAPRVGRYRELAEGFASLLEGAGLSSTVRVGIKVAASLSPYEALEQLRSVIVDAIVDVERLPDAAARLAILDDAIALDCEWRQACIDAMAAAAADNPPPVRHPGNDVELVTADSVTRYLRNRFPDRTSLAAVSVRRLAGGRSKNTFIIELENAAPWPSRVVMRQDAGRHALITKVVEEYVVVEGVARQGIKVARPLMLESEQSELGSQFYLMDFVEGEPTGNFYVGLFETDPARRWQFALDLAAAFAELHALDPATVLPDAPSHIEYLTGQITHFKNQWRDSAIEKSPLISAAFVWLEEEVRKGIGGAAIVHGDPAVHNILVRDGRLAALIDWELYSVGDPAADLAYVRTFMEPAVDWDGFLAAYVAAGGQPIDERRLKMFEVWGNIRNAAIAAGGGRAFLADPGAKFELAFMGAATGYLEQLLLPLFRSPEPASVGE